MIIEALVSVFLLAGAFFALVGSIGLARLGDFYSRLHGPTKATTLGVGGMLVASSIFFSAQGAGVSVHELLVTGFLFLTAPVSAHLLARTALHLKVKSVSSGTPRDAGTADVDTTPATPSADAE